MRPIRADLWETSAGTLRPGQNVHGYLWTGGPHGNVLFYGLPTEDDFERIDALGGIAHQYLSHHGEANPMVARVSERFGAKLHAPMADLAVIGEHARVDVVWTERHEDRNGIEVVPTPGHTPGSTCFLVPGAYGQCYLLTGDTIMLDADGDWVAGYVPEFSDAGQLSASLRLLSHLRPNLVITSAFPGQSGVHAATGTGWVNNVARARQWLAAGGRLKDLGAAALDCLDVERGPIRPEPVG